MRRAWLRGLLLLACLLCLTGTARAQGVRRALLIGSDSFVSQPSTVPSSANNVERMAAALDEGDARFERMVSGLSIVRLPLPLGYHHL